MVEPEAGTFHSRHGWIVAGGCAGLLLIFAMLAHTAAAGKSATFDEPLHVLGGYVHRYEGDFRINPEDPPLFGMFAALLVGRDEIKLDRTQSDWAGMLENFNMHQWPFVASTLYGTRPVDADGLIQRERGLFIVFGLLLGALIAWWSWKTAGATGAIMAAALFAFDPNFLGHSALVKNDVLFSLLMAWTALAIWQFGRRGTIASGAAIAVSCALALNVKLTGVLCGPIIFLLLLARAMLGEEWIVLGKSLRTRMQRLIVVPAVCAMVAIACYIGIWVIYGFRFSPTPDPSVQMRTQTFVEMSKSSQVMARLPIGSVMTQEMIDAQPPGLPVDLAVWAEAHRLLPQAWVNGFLYTYATALVRYSYLLGEISNRGWWYYFPLAMLFKTPIATLIGLFAAGIIGVVLLAMRFVFAHSASKARTIDLWSLLCLIVPVVIYMASAMSSNLNLGLRHVLPVNPFIFILTAIALSRLLDQWKWIGISSASVLLVGLIIESMIAYPNYIAFFNGFVGGPVNGLDYLGDSNLDWGQDLKVLADFQHKHPFEKMYLSYFGTADPKSYGINATNMPGGWRFDPAPQFPGDREPCYFVISATNLQGIYYPRDRREFYRKLQDYEPTVVLGGTIYVYEWPVGLRGKKKPGR